MSGNHRTGTQIRLEALEAVQRTNDDLRERLAAAEAGRTQWAAQAHRYLTDIGALTAQNAALREAADAALLSIDSDLKVPGVRYTNENIAAAKAARAQLRDALADPNPRAEELLRLAGDPDAVAVAELHRLHVSWAKNDEWPAAVCSAPSASG